MIHGNVLYWIVFYSIMFYCMVSYCKMYNVTLCNVRSHDIISWYFLLFTHILIFSLVCAEVHALDHSGSPSRGVEEKDWAVLGQALPSRPCAARWLRVKCLILCACVSCVAFCACIEFFQTMTKTKWRFFVMTGSSDVFYLRRLRTRSKLRASFSSRRDPVWQNLWKTNRGKGQQKNKMNKKSKNPFEFHHFHFQSTPQCDQTYIRLDPATRQDQTFPSPTIFCWLCVWCVSWSGVVCLRACGLAARLRGACVCVLRGVRCAGVGVDVCVGWHVIGATWQKRVSVCFLVLRSGRLASQTAGVTGWMCLFWTSTRSTRWTCSWKCLAGCVRWFLRMPRSHGDNLVFVIKSSHDLTAVISRSVWSEMWCSRSVEAQLLPFSTSTHLRRAYCRLRWCLTGVFCRVVLAALGLLERFARAVNMTARGDFCCFLEVQFTSRSRLVGTVANIVFASSSPWLEQVNLIHLGGKWRHCFFGLAGCFRVRLSHRTVIPRDGPRDSDEDVTPANHPRHGVYRKVRLCTCLWLSTSTKPSVSRRPLLHDVYRQQVCQRDPIQTLELSRLFVNPALLCAQSSSQRIFPVRVDASRKVKSDEILWITWLTISSIHCSDEEKTSRQLMISEDSNFYWGHFTDWQGHDDFEFSLLSLSSVQWWILSVMCVRFNVHPIISVCEHSSRRYSAMVTRQVVCFAGFW